MQCLISDRTIFSKQGNNWTRFLISGVSTVVLFPFAEFVPSRFERLAVLAILGVATSPAFSTDIEPRAYFNIPVGLNFLLAGYGYTKGNVTFAPSVPIENGKMEIHSAVLAYVRSLDLLGRSGKVDVIIPEAWLSGQAEFTGRPIEREISSFADPIIRLYVNLFDAPALSMKEFAGYQQDIIIGAKYYTGGRVTMDGKIGDNLQQNWRVGGTLSFPNNRHKAKPDWFCSVYGIYPTLYQEQLCR